ncbi:MAG: peptidase [Verrucomicrobiales bacterium]|nr:peptidase [Verrucomicrobiales bacterium]
MNFSNTTAWAILGLLVLRWVVQLWLDRLNLANVRANAATVPDAFKNIMDEATYRKSVAYTLAKGRLRGFQLSYDFVVLLIVLLSGLLPHVFEAFTRAWGASAWAGAAFLFIVTIALAIPGLPLDWYEQFHLEERFGFNTTTPKLWCLDRVKGLLLGLILGYPLIVLVLKFVEWTGSNWWLWAWGSLMAFQLLMLVLAPIIIMPLFNKFTPLPEGSLRERLLTLGQKTGFHSKTIQVMDGSKRSRHSNAFFTGFGQFRKIVLFDTLVQQLSEVELEAVLAHEIGHYKKRHIPKMLLASAAGSLVGFYALSWLARQPWFLEAFGFAPGQLSPAVLLFTLLSGAVTFWLSPLAHFWSRRYEYQADRYAAETMGEPLSLTNALRKLNEKNLSNLTPHPLYSGFYYSHPTLLERERALKSLSNSAPA